MREDSRYGGNKFKSWFLTLDNLAHEFNVKILMWQKDHKKYGQIFSLFVFNTRLLSL